MEQIGDGQPKRIRQLLDIVQADVPLGAFDAADVGSMKSCLGGEGFLGPVSLEPKLAQLTGEEVAGGVVGGQGVSPGEWRCGEGDGWPGCRGGVLRAGDRQGWREVAQYGKQLRLRLEQSGLQPRGAV